MKKKLLKGLSVFLALNILAEVFFPTVAYALTGGPSQPEVQSFEPVGTTEMVDLFSGDFVYNIPLLDVEGYPINIAYHSGITMDQEASWVGLGWNINPGTINRNMRGLPDDFREDVVKKDMFIKPNYTYGLSFGAAFELFALDYGKIKMLKKIQGNLSVSMGVFYNNYKGVGFEQSITPSVSAGNKLKLNGALSISSSTQNGLTISPSTGITLSHISENKAKESEAILGVGFSVGASYNSRSGIKSLTFGKSFFASTAKMATDLNGNKEMGFRGTMTGGNGGSSVAYAYDTYVPQVSMPMSNLNMTFNSKFGASNMGATGGVFLSGYFSSQSIASTSVSKSSYGYLYAGEARAKGDVLHDVNREKDGSYSANNPILPVTNFSYDLYAVTGQGIGGMFRPYRSDIGHIHDDESRSGGAGGIAGGEFGVGNLLKWGADVNFNHSYSRSKKWADNEGNGLASTLKFLGKDDVGNDPAYEPVYFKNTGEKTVAATSSIAYADLNAAVRPAFGSNGTQLESRLLPNVLIKNDGNETVSDANKMTFMNDATHKAKRDPRNQHIQYLTVAEANACIEPQMRSYEPRNFGSGNYQTISRSEGQRKPHHITQISVVNPGGSRYIYGIAAYNQKQEEISFTAKSVSTDACVTGLTSYSKSYYEKKRGEEADGYDSYYNATTLPGYAHSYLLTSVLSPDYVDVTQDGITEDDLGNYTRINYSRTSSDYKWRVPYEKDKAMYNQGLRTDIKDDKGTILYGEKEMWYMHSIESKNYIAEFKIFQRADGVDAEDVHGGMRTNNPRFSYHLESISLYTKAEKAAHPNDPTPIKVVHFEYSYSLCKDVPNNNHTITANYGKLTLKKIYFTYGKSSKGKLNSYQFEYEQEHTGPVYNVKAYDRWGNYKPNITCSCNTGEGGCVHPPNPEFPYTTQDAAEANENASVWNLSKIKLPSGGEIDVTYESDDYAYVQNKRAMQMYLVKGFSKSGGSDSDHRLYEIQSDGTQQAHNYVHVTLATACDNVNEFEKRYIPEATNDGDNTRYLFFNFLVYLEGSTGNKEYVRGYAEIDHQPNAGDYIKKVSATEYAIKVKDVASGDSPGTSRTQLASPFAKTAWQFMRIHMPQYVYPNSDMSKNIAGGPLIAKVLFGIFFDIYEYFEGVNDILLGKEMMQQVQVNSSWVRLQNPDGFKKGGGVRVKRIELSDSWSSMNATNGVNSSYGQEYTYTTENADGIEISSGVASYEPTIGNEENPFRQPILYKKTNALVPDYTFYAEEPMGESFFPAPSVGYSKITVRNLQHEDVTKHATGKMVHEFYTTKDFPTITRRTDVRTSVVKPNWIGGLFSLSILNEVSVAQGYAVELNDMNGKPKAQWVYGENLATATNNNDKLISGLKYTYKTDPDNPSHLNNNVKVIDATGKLIDDPNTLVGVDADMVMDTRQHESFTESYGAATNADMFTVFGPTTILPMVLPSYSSEKTRFRSAVITRVIQRYGILEKTEVFHENSTITTENYAYDAVTGEVLLTKTINEYDDPVYSLTYPAHWTYNGMGPAYKNADIELSLTIQSTGEISVPVDKEKWLVPGDELLSNGERLWVNEDYKIIDKDNTVKTGNLLVKVIRSGRRNMQSIPVSSITTKKLPVQESGGQKFVRGFDGSKQILSAVSSEFTDVWKPYCNIVTSDMCNEGGFDAHELVDALNYLYRGGFVGNSEVTNEEVNITQNSSYPAEYAAYENSFIKEVFEICSFNEKFKYDHANDPGSSIQRTWTFTFEQCRTVYGAQNNFKCRVMVPYGADECNQSVNNVVKIEYVSDNITYPDNGTTVSGGINVKIYFSESCYVMGTISMSITGDVARYGACKEICVTQKPVNGNEYLKNIRGAWRKKKDFLYLDNRLPVDNTATNIRKDGYYSTFEPFWVYSSNTWQMDPAKWTWTSESMNYVSEGLETENRDPLNRYNAAVFESDRSPSLVANNAERREVAFDGFEFYNARATETCPDRHWNFRNGPYAYTIDNEVSHTGHHSLKLTGGQQAKNTYFIRGCEPNSNAVYNGQALCNSCVMPFAPYPGREYVISGWVKVDVGSEGNINNRDAIVEVSFGGGSSVPVSVNPSGTIIEGWQRFEKKVFIPATATTISVVLKQATGNKTTWYDDIRLFPVNGNMKTFVYHPANKRVMAIMDENNYASFYEYDEEGALKRVKKETEEGVMTIQESRNHIKKNP